MALGIIPEEICPSYGLLRNRICEDKTEWLIPKMKEFLNSKLNETNKEYSKVKKIKISLKNLMLKIFSVRKIYNDRKIQMQLIIFGIKMTMSRSA